MSVSATLTNETTPLQLHRKAAAHGGLLEARSVPRKEVDPQAGDGVPGARRRILAWQARKVREYIDGHIPNSILVADLCALVGLSEAHFARCFKQTFETSPHAFVVRRRVELAAGYMLQTEAPLSDIALRCGFADQAHLSKRFREATGVTPAAWRRSTKSRNIAP